ncbi:MSC_0623 family F1-like ATPase-associated protein [Mycoplasma simbae]|uniref:MSC_0623 family F1-like ATPase-associated protein n=1 Tax=Mycoplasma simbae TaxID=36744 RepID=UPI0004980928|nr:DUF2714 domain-containing protein [Mycoplasma simbae]
MSKQLSKKEINQLKRVNELRLFDLYQAYEAKIKQPNFISFEQLNASVLLSMGLGFESVTFTTYKDLLTKGVENKWNLVFKDFVVGFDIISKFSDTILVPIILESEQSASDSVNLANAQSTQLDEFLIKLNSKINELLANNNLIEIIPHSVFYKSEQTDKLKLLFGKELLARIEK